MPCPSRSSLAASVAVAGAGFVPVAAFGLGVVSTSPPPYDLDVPASLAAISVTLDAPPVLPGAGAFRVFGTMSGLKTGTVSVAGNTLTFTHVADWQPGETVNVNLRSDVQTAGGDPLAGGHYFSFTVESGPGTLAWSAPLVYGTADVPYFIYGGDIDGDGTPDVATPNEGTDDLSIFRNPNGDGVFDSHVDYGVGGIPSCVFGEDFDNDGDVDLATADHLHTMSVLLNNGDGTFAPATILPAGSNCRQVHGGDFDGDNDVDLCATSHNTGEIYLFENQGNGTFSPGVAYSDVAAGPFAITTADLDGSGHLDIAVAAQVADSVTVLINDGTGSFTTAGSYKVANGPWDLVANDMDGDGDCDLIHVAAFGNRIQVVFNDGTGAFPTRLAQFTGNFPLGVHATDLDGDGDIDATASCFNSGVVNTFRNDGVGGLTLQATLNVDRSGSYAWGHDLDGDGDLDLSVVDELSDSLFVFYNGPSPVGAPTPAPGVVGGPKLTAWPNPALASRGFDIGLEGLEGRVVVELIAVTGRRVGVIWDGDLPPGGVIPWRDSAALAAGAYVVSARDGSHQVSTTVRLIR